MKKVFKAAFLFIMAGLTVSCQKENANDTVPLRDYAEQYATDINTIKTFMKTHSITVTNHPGFVDDQDVAFTVVPELDPSSIWGSDDTTHKPDVLELTVAKDNITYTVYYLKLREGSGPTSKSPCNLDGVLAAYKGYLINDSMTVFDSNNYPQTVFNLPELIRGWGEVFPKFRTGTYTTNPDGSTSYIDFGAGVMFLPSGLGYYNGGTSTVPGYSPLIFSFKLYEVQRMDSDGDGIPSYLEDISGDGYIRDYDVTGSYEDDTDHDGVPDAVDVDDDADGVLTKIETQYTISGTTYHYPFDGAAVDDLATPQDETKGIPSCSGDYTTPGRVRKHLDSSCQ